MGHSGHVKSMATKDNPSISSSLSLVKQMRSLNNKDDPHDSFTYRYKSRGKMRKLANILISTGNSAKVQQMLSSFTFKPLIQALMFNRDIYPKTDA